MYTLPKRECVTLKSTLALNHVICISVAFVKENYD